MFRRAYRLPLNLAGIPLYLDISFLIVFPLMVWVTARNLALIVRPLHLDAAAFEGWIPIMLGGFSVLGLFACIVLHELGHAITAQKYGVKVRRITLWFLGGMAEFEEMPRQRGAEAVVAIAGPIVSFALAGIFFALSLVVPRTSPALWIVVWYLWVVNLMLGLFNLIPAMPLDGGRVLRSLLALAMPHVRATAIAGTVAKAIAILLGVWGVMSLNVWTMILAFFIFNAATRETEYSVVVEMLRGIGVRDLVNRDVRTVGAGMTVGELSQFVMLHRHKSFPVVDDQGRLIGTVGVEQMDGADRNTPVWQVMQTQIMDVPEDASALDAFGRMSANGFGRLIVLGTAGELVGIITKSDLMRAIQVRMLGYPVGEHWTPVATGEPYTVRRAPHPYVPAARVAAPPPAAGADSAAPPPGHHAAPSAPEQSPAAPVTLPPGYAAPPPGEYTGTHDETGNPERFARPL